MICGPQCSGGLASGSAELYNPATGTWTATGNLNTAREQHTATLLFNGMALAAAGGTGLTFLASAELYDGPTPPPGGTVTSTTCGRTAVGTAPTEFTVNLTDPADPATVQASDFTVNGTPADSDIISNGDLTITFQLACSWWAKHDAYSCWRFRLRPGAGARIHVHVFLQGGWGYSASGAASDSARSPDFAITSCGGFATRRLRQGSSFAEKFPRTVTSLDV
jgi:hypothetical protein